MKRAPLSQFAGALLVLLGGAVMLGWLLQISPLVEVLPKSTPMVFNTALSFALAGAALVAPLAGPDRRVRVTSVLGGALVIVASLALVETHFQADLGIDWASMHSWLHDANPHPGRMSVGTATGFLMSGAVLILATRALRAWIATAVRVLTLGVGAIGVLALAGYLVDAQLLFPQYLFAGIAVHTAAGLLLLSVGLRSLWTRLAWGRIPILEREDDRITFIGATMLAAVALGAGIATFAILQGRVQTLVRDHLLASLTRRAEMLQDLIQLREVNARIAATRPAVLANLRTIHAGRDDGSNLANVTAVADGFAKLGYSAIAYYDLDGNAVARSGGFAQAPAIAVTLATPDRAELLWDGGFVLRHRLPMHDSAGKVGEVISEQPLPVLTRLTQLPEGTGETWDMGVCARRGQELLCFPQRLNPRVFSTPLVNVAGEPLPMTLALRGETGTIITRDYRAQNVVAAYAPLGSLGLGMVLKVDAAEVFTPIREQLQFALGLLLCLVAGGTLLLRSRVRPLATKLMDAEKQARTREQTLRQSAERLGESEARLLAFMNNSPSVMFFKDLEGRYLHVNEQFARSFGLNVNDIVSRTDADLFSPQQAARFMQNDATALAAGTSVQVEEVALYGDGPHTSLVCKFPIYDGHGRVAALGGFVTDITERKRLEEALREKNTELMNALQAKDRFLAIMSHELRTPLNAIIGFTGTLLMKLPGPLNADQEKQLRTVQASGKHLLSLINDLLDLAKIEAGKIDLNLEPTVCQDVLEEAVATLRPPAESKRLELLVAAPAVKLVVHTDRRALSQIVLNLLNNAIKFTERGSVCVTLSRREVDGNGVVELSVQDTGVGIRPEDQARLFVAFTQVDTATRRREGTGLGLYLSRKLAALLGGAITCRSEYGKGSTFTLQLPQG